MRTQLSDSLARGGRLLQLGAKRRRKQIISGPLPSEARGDPEIEETSGYTAAFERSMRLLEPLLEIETQIEETTATTLAGVLIQARLLKATLSLSGHGGDRLLASIIAGLEEMNEPADGG